MSSDRLSVPFRPPGIIRRIQKWNDGNGDVTLQFATCHDNLTTKYEKQFKLQSFVHVTGFGLKSAIKRHDNLRQVCNNPWQSMTIYVIFYPVPFLLSSLGFRPLEAPETKAPYRGVSTILGVILVLIYLLLIWNSVGFRFWVVPHYFRCSVYFLVVWILLSFPYFSAGAQEEKGPENRGRKGSDHQIVPCLAKPDLTCGAYCWAAWRHARMERWLSAIGSTETPPPRRNPSYFTFGNHLIISGGWEDMESRCHSSCRWCLSFLVLEPGTDHAKSWRIMALKVPENAWRCLIPLESPWSVSVERLYFTWKCLALLDA